MPAAPAHLDIQNGVADLVLNRPAKLNAIDEGMLAALETCIDDAEQDARVRAIVVRGAGKAFCAGADLAAAAERVDDPHRLRAHLDDWNRVFRRLAESSVPSIAAVHGVAVAGGFELMQACDLIVLADDARVGDIHATWGLFPAAGGTQRLPRQLGIRRATWLLLSGEHLDPADALSAGFVNAVVPADDVVAHAHRMAAVLAQRSPAGTAGMKQAIRHGLAAGSLLEGLAIERHFVERHMATKDVRIGIDAFHRRSAPEFVGE